MLLEERTHFAVEHLLPPTQVIAVGAVQEQHRGPGVARVLVVQAKAVCSMNAIALPPFLNSRYHAAYRRPTGRRCASPRPLDRVHGHPGAEGGERRDRWPSRAKIAASAGRRAGPGRRSRGRSAAGSRPWAVSDCEGRSEKWLCTASHLPSRRSSTKVPRPGRVNGRPSGPVASVSQPTAIHALSPDARTRASGSKWKSRMRGQTFCHCSRTMLSRPLTARAQVPKVPRRRRTWCGRPRSPGRAPPPRRCEATARVSVVGWPWRHYAGAPRPVNPTPPRPGMWHAAGHAPV